MSTEFVNQENQQWRSHDTKFRLARIKGADTDVFKDGQLLNYDPADDTFIAYTGLAGETARAILNLGVGEEITLDVADTLTPDASICISGEVIDDGLVMPAGVALDDRPNGAVLSVREQLREAGIIVRDTTNTFESNLS